MIQRFVSFVRIFYTVELLLLGLGILVLFEASRSAAAAGHGSFNLFSLQDTLVVGLFLLLLSSRILVSRSPKWLLLGVPTNVALLILVWVSLL